MSLFNDEDAHAIRYLADAVGEGLQRIGIALHRFSVVAEPIANALDSIARDYHFAVYEPRTPPPKPGAMSARLISEEENGMAHFAVLLPALDLSDPHQRDIITRHVIVTAADGTVQELEGPRDSIELGPFSGPKGTYQASLHDHDDDGNESETASNEIVVADTTAPPRPGVVGVRLIDEEE